MKVLYNVASGDVLGYANVGAMHAEEGEAVIEWSSGVIDRSEDYRVQNDVVVRKDDTEITERDTDRSFVWLRNKRDERLATSDWRDLPSYPGTNQEAWRSYRQALRDLPANTVDPNNIIWPSEPE